MKKIGVTIGGLVLGIIFAVGAQGHAETSGSVVYTGYTGADATGNGTKENPYSCFEDALENVADGGTIYITEANAGFINDPGNDMPLIITKNVTIKPEPGATSATLDSRAAGIVLGADVTFENISLGFANAYHDQIFANGHTLTLKNVSRASGCRLVDLAAGTIYDTTGNLLVGNAGSESKIIVENSYIGNIYAGSINGSWDGNVSIQTKNLSNEQIGEIYGSGAQEAQFDRDNWFDLEEPPAPVADASVYPVEGQVCISIEDTSTTQIDGAGASNGTILECATTYLNSYTNMKNLNVLKVKSGCFTPPMLSFIGNDTKIEVPSGGTLDFSTVGDFSIENFIGGGTIVVGEKNCFTITKSATGTSAFEVEGGTNGESGWAEQEHTYIIAPSDSTAEFTFTPSVAQEDVKLERQTDGSWKIVSNGLVYIAYNPGTFGGDVQENWEFVHPTEGTAVGTVAIPNAGYHFVNWVDENDNIVGTEARFIPPKTNGVYVEAYYYANFAEGEPEITPTPSPTPSVTVSPTLTVSVAPTISPSPDVSISPTPTGGIVGTEAPTETLSPGITPSLPESQPPMGNETPMPTSEIIMKTISPNASATPEIMETGSPLPTGSVITTKEPANQEDIPMATIIPIPTESRVPTESEGPKPTEGQVPTESEGPIPTEGQVPTISESPIPTGSQAPIVSEFPMPTISAGTEESAAPTPTISPDKTTSKKVEKGQVYKDKKTGNKYKVVSVKSKTVAFIGNENKNIKSAVIANTITISKVKYKVTVIEAKALSNYKKLQKVIVGKYVKKIEAKAFYKCSALKKVTLHSTSMASIGEKVFYGDKKLTTVIVNATNLTSKKIHKNAFQGTGKELVVKVPKKKVSTYKKFFMQCGNKTIAVEKM